MAESWQGNYDPGSQSDDSYHEKLRSEPIYESFVCPLTKQVMRDPVIIENGQTFEREAIEKWFKDRRETRQKPICPLTLKELSSSELNPSKALRNTIEEWTQRNESNQLEIACRSLAPGSSETEILLALNFITTFCQKSRSNKSFVGTAEMIPAIADMLTNSSRKVRCKALDTLRVVAEEADGNKEVMAAGGTIRTIVKFLSHDQSQGRDEAVSLLYELSKSETLSEKIGGVSGAILILVGMSSSNTENILTVETAERTLENLEKCENNVRQMADNGRLLPLLTLILEGSPETQLSMASYLGELVLSNDVKVFVAQTAGSALIDVMGSGSIQAREAALKALNQISSYDSSAKILIQAGILPPLVNDLFSFGINQSPLRLEVSATVLANVVSSGSDFKSIIVDDDDRTLVSESVIHKLLHLISNTGPSIESKLLQVLVGLTSSTSTVEYVVSAIKSSGAIVSLIQFVEAPRSDARVASIKLLRNISPHMGQELADAFRASAALTTSLTKLISESNGISEEHTATIELLAEILERDSVLTKRLLAQGVFGVVIAKVHRVREGSTRGSRFFKLYLEGLVKVLSRLTYLLEVDPNSVSLAQEHNFTEIFTDLLQMNGLDNVQTVSAIALKNLSQRSKHLTRLPEASESGFFASIFSCFSKPKMISGVCVVHCGVCSAKETFCLVEGRVVEKLVACLDHANEKVVEAALAALCTLLEDGVDIEQGVTVLYDAEGIKPIFQVLLENQSEVLRERSIWAVERILRTEDIAYAIMGDQNVGTALVEAFRNGNCRTKQIAEKALKLVDKLPNFSGIFPKVGA